MQLGLLQNRDGIDGRGTPCLCEPNRGSNPIAPFNPVMKISLNLLASEAIIV